MALERETLDQLLETVRRFVGEQLIPNEDRICQEDAIPPEIVSQMRQLGLFGYSIPEEYGGIGLNMSEEVQLVFELSQASPACRSLVGTNNGIGSQGIILDGSKAQMEKYLPRLASGEIIGSFALTEPDFGSDAASIRTTAHREGEHYVINGTKRYITNAPEAGLFTLMARTGPKDSGADGISCFLVEAPTPGLKLGPPDKKMGMSGSHTCDVIFEDCRVPASQLLGGQEGQGFRTAMKVLDRGRLSIAAACVGVAERLIRDSLTFAAERKQFGRPIADFQLVQAMLADSRTEAYAARAMVTDAAARYDSGETVATLAACCKLFASEMVGRVADRAVQIHGGAGYVADYPVERFYRDVRLFRLYEGTSQIQQLIIARNMIRDHAG